MRQGAVGSKEWRKNSAHTEEERRGMGGKVMSFYEDLFYF